MNKSIDTFNAACKSIRVDYSYDPSMSLEGNLEALGNAEGYEEARGNKTWVERVHVWARSKDSKFLTFNLRGEPVIVENQKEKQELAFDVEAGYEFGESPTILPFWDSQGNILAQVLNSGDAVISTQIELADKTPLPLDEAQPEMSISEQARMLIDLISGGLFTLTYRRGLRRQWGARMAPKDANTTIWLRVLIVAVAFTALLSRLFFRKKS